MLFPNASKTILKKATHAQLSRIWPTLFIQLKFTSNSPSLSLQKVMKIKRLHIPTNSPTEIRKIMNLCDVYLIFFFILGLAEWRVPEEHSCEAQIYKSLFDCMCLFIHYSSIVHYEVNVGKRAPFILEIKLLCSLTFF